MHTNAQCHIAVKRDMESTAKISNDAAWEVQLRSKASVGSHRHLKRFLYVGVFFTHWETWAAGTALASSPHLIHCHWWQGLQKHLWVPAYSLNGLSRAKQLKNGFTLALCGMQKPLCRHSASWNYLCWMYLCWMRPVPADVLAYSQISVCAHHTLIVRSPAFAAWTRTTVALPNWPWSVSWCFRKVWPC